MNESSAYLWKIIQQQDSFTEEDLAKLLTAEYDVDDATALADATELAKQWLEAGIIEP